MKLIPTILVLLVTALSALAQVSPPSGSLEGSVVRSGSTDPVPRARVILNAASGTRTALTDDAGRFSLRDLPPGRYQLLVTRDGYVRAEYGQRSLGSAGVPITVGAGQTLREVVLSMMPAGAISGRILNGRSEPFSNVAVRALRYTNDTGRPTLTAIEVVRTNDLGEYRLYYLEPGQYLVSANPPLGLRTQAQDAGGQFAVAGVDLLPGNPAGREASTATRSGIFTTARQLARYGFLSTTDTHETYAPSYFPGTADLSAAVPIRVEPGATVSAVDFILSPVPAVTIRGQVTNSSTGQPQGGAAVVLLSPGHGSDGIPIDNYGSVSATGAFEFRGVAPGFYEVVASVGRLPAGIPTLPDDFAGGAMLNRNALRLSSPAANAPRMAGRVSIRVGSTDLDRVSVALHPGFALNGKISVEGLSPAQSEAITSGVLIQLQPDPPDIVPESHPTQRVQTGSLPSTVGAGGAFTVAGVFPGTYQIGILNAVRMPPNAYVKSVRFGNADALNPRLRIDDSPQGTLEIVIGTNPGNLDASVVNDRQAPAPAMTVVLVPDAPYAQHFDLYRTGVTDDSGHARIANVVPGSYTAYALETARAGIWWDPEFTKRNEGRGLPVVITDGGAPSLDLKSIPAGAGQ